MRSAGVRMEHAGEVRVFESPEALTAEAATEFLHLALEAVEQTGQFSVALAGGSTPKRLYQMLAEKREFRERLPWNRIHFFWGDERHVPPGHADSNYRMAFEAMLSKVPVAKGQIHRIKTEDPDASHAARQYEELLRHRFQLKDDGWPRFNLVLLGLGSDGHTASLFPGTEVLNDQRRLVAAPWVEKFGAFRVTLTSRVFNEAQSVIFLVSGEDKAVALNAVLRGRFEPQRFPAQLIRPLNGRLLWLVDREATRVLQNSAG